MGAFPISLRAYVAGMQSYNASGNVHTLEFGEKLRHLHHWAPFGQILKQVKKELPQQVTSPSIKHCRGKPWHPIALILQQSLLTTVNLPPSQRARGTSRQQKWGLNGPWSNGSCRACASVWSSPYDTGYVLMLHFHRLKSSDDIIKELTVSSNHGFLYIQYIQMIVSEFKQIISHMVLNGAWSAYMVSVEDVTMFHCEHLINLLWPSTTDALGPNHMPSVTHVAPRARAPLRTDTPQSIGPLFSEASLTAFQFISSLSSSLNPW